MVRFRLKTFKDLVNFFRSKGRDYTVVDPDNGSVLGRPENIVNWI